MNKLASEFRMGFTEGWTMFWSPFIGFLKAVIDTWHRHVVSQGCHHV